MTGNQGSTRTWLLKIPLVLAAGLALAAAGCGPDFDTMCEDRESCHGGNDMDVEACVEFHEGLADYNSDIGCEDEFDEYWECFIDTASCSTDGTGTSCSSDDDCHDPTQSCQNGECVERTYELPNPDDCEEANNAYHRCSDWE